MEDPRGFLARMEGSKGFILDEVQRCPDIFSYLQAFVDEQRSGPVVLTGSQHFLLSEKISQSLAGRAAILELLPFSLAELTGRAAITPDAFVAQPNTQAPEWKLEDILVKGMYPPIHDRKSDAAAWLDGYLATYVERDIRTLSNIGNLDTFVRFVRLCAGRAGQLLNASSLGSDTGISHDTVRRWISLLRTSYIINLLPPYHRNFRKRLVKSPKLYFNDSGLLCHLLGIRDSEQLRTHPLRGAIFENFIYSELVKMFQHHGQRPSLYFWRDRSGNEVDFILETGPHPVAIEVKSGQTVASDFFKNLDKYGKLSGEPGGVLVYGGDESFKRREHQVRAWFGCS